MLQLKCIQVYTASSGVVAGEQGSNSPPP